MLGLQILDAVSTGMVIVYINMHPDWIENGGVTINDEMISKIEIIEDENEIELVVTEDVTYNINKTVDIDEIVIIANYLNDCYFFFGCALFTKSIIKNPKKSRKIVLALVICKK